MPFGSVFSKLDYVLLTQYSVKTNDDSILQFKNNAFTRVGFRILGIPHIGLRLRAAKIMKDIPANISKMLDAGFGTGAYSFTLAHKVKQIDAVDNESRKAAYVKEVNPFKNISFQVMDLTKLDFSDSEYDLIICSDVIEHIADDRTAFSELARVLKKDGILLLTVPYDSNNNRKTYREYSHQRPGYTQEDMETLCDTNRLKILETRAYSYSIAEKVSAINYRIAKKKICLSLLFYPLYLVALAGDSLLHRGEPNGIYFRMHKI